MSSKSNIYCFVPGCTQTETVDPEGNRVGFFGLPNDQKLSLSEQTKVKFTASFSWLGTSFLPCVRHL